MALTAKQEKFAQAVIAGKSQADAYRTAYNAKNMAAKTIVERACVLAKNDNVRTMIEQGRSKVAAKAFDIASLNKAWVLEKLAKVVDLGMMVNTLTDAEGNPIGIETENLSAANKALELIGKEDGMFVDRKEIRHGALEGLAHDELRALNEFLAGIPAGAAGESAGRITH